MVAYRQSYEAYHARQPSADDLNRQEAARNPHGQVLALAGQRSAAPARTATPATPYWDGVRYWSGTKYWTGTAWVEAAQQPRVATNIAMPPAPGGYQQPRSAYARYAPTAQLARYPGWPATALTRTTDPATVSTAPSEFPATERFRGLVREAVRFCSNRIHAIGMSTTDVENICMRMMGIESHGFINPGGAGTVGLMQLQPSTARTMIAKYDLPVRRNLLDPRTNIMCGVNYYVDMLEMYGSYRTAAAAYNWGPYHEALYEGNEARYPGRTQDYIDTAMGYA